MNSAMGVNHSRAPVVSGAGCTSDFLSYQWNNCLWSNTAGGQCFFSYRRQAVGWMTNGWRWWHELCSRTVLLMIHKWFSVIWVNETEFNFLVSIGNLQGQLTLKLPWCLSPDNRKPWTFFGYLVSSLAELSRHWQMAKGGGEASVQVSAKPNKLPLRGSVTEDTPSVFGTYPETAPSKPFIGPWQQPGEIKNKFSTRHSCELRLPSEWRQFYQPFHSLSPRFCS